MGRKWVRASKVDGTVSVKILRLDKLGLFLKFGKGLNKLEFSEQEEWKLMCLFSGNHRETKFIFELYFWPHSHSYFLRFQFIKSFAPHTLLVSLPRGDFYLSTF